MTTTFVKGLLIHYYETAKHKFWVAWYMLRLSPIVYKSDVSLFDWACRALRHDWSKYTWIESKWFAKGIKDLNRAKYGTHGYKAAVNRIRPGVTAHQLRNDHHPEFWVKVRQEFGWSPETEPMQIMPLICKMEMLCDWAAAVRRGKDGSIARSIEVGARRVGYDEGGVEWIRLVAWAHYINAQGIKDLVG